MGFFDFESKVDGKPLSEIYGEKTKLDKPKYKEVTNYNVCKCPNCGELANVTLNDNSNKVGLAGAGATTVAMGSTIKGFAIALKIVTFGLIGLGGIISIMLPPLLIILIPVFFITRKIHKDNCKHTIECPHCHKKYEVTQAQLDELTL